MSKRKKKIEPMTISEQLRQAIRDSGLTNYRVAKMAELDPANVTRFLTGTELRSNSMDRIAAALGLELCRKPGHDIGRESDV